MIIYIIAEGIIRVRFEDIYYCLTASTSLCHAKSDQSSTPDGSFRSRTTSRTPSSSPPIPEQNSFPMAHLEPVRIRDSLSDDESLVRPDSNGGGSSGVHVQQGTVRHALNVWDDLYTAEIHSQVKLPGNLKLVFMV